MKIYWVTTLNYFPAMHFFKVLWNITVPTHVSPVSNFTINYLLISLVLIIKMQIHQQICFHQSKVLIIIYYH